MPQFGSRAIEVNKELLNEMRIARGDGTLLEVKPYEDSDRGIPDAVELFRAFHNRSDWNGINTSPINSFEMWFDGESLRFFMYILEESDVRRGIRHIASNFPGARITVPDEASEQTIPAVNEGDYIVGTRFRLAKHFFEPIRSPDGVKPFRSTYSNILTEMTDDKEVSTVVQVLFRPAGTSWTTSFFNDAAEYAEGLAGSSSKAEYKELVAGEEEEASGPSELAQYAKLIKSQIGQPGYYINLRVLTISEDEEAAINEADDLATSYRQYYREFSGQTFVPTEAQGSRVRQLALDVVSREGQYMDWPQSPFVLQKRKTRGYCETMIMTVDELAGLAHFPNGDSVNESAIDWERLDTTNRMPSKAPTYDDYKSQIEGPVFEPEAFTEDEESEEDEEDGGAEAATQPQ